LLMKRQLASGDDLERVAGSSRFYVEIRMSRSY
jgi:hypothetical protein